MWAAHLGCIAVVALACALPSPASATFFSHEGVLEFAQILCFLCWNDQEIFSYVVICVYWVTYVEPFPACLEWSQLDHSEWLFCCNLEFGFQVTCSEFLPLYSSGSTVIFPVVLFLSGLGPRLIMSSLKTLEAFLPFLFCGTIWTVLLSALLWRAGRILQWGCVWSWEAFQLEDRFLLFLLLQSNCWP